MFGISMDLKSLLILNQKPVQEKDVMDEIYKTHESIQWVQTSAFCVLWIELTKLLFLNFY